MVVSTVVPSHVSTAKAFMLTMHINAVMQTNNNANVFFIFLPPIFFGEFALLKFDFWFIYFLFFLCTAVEPTVSVYAVLQSSRRPARLDPI